MLEPAEEEQRRDVLSAEPNADVQAQHDRAVPGLEGADDLTPPNSIALGHERGHRFERRQHAARVLERQHRSVDDDPSEVHDPVRGGVNHGRRALDVDAAVSRTVRRGGGEVGASDDARWVNGPQPVRGRGRDSTGGHEQQGEEQVHAPSVRRDRSATAGERDVRGEPRKQHPVQECYDSGCISKGMTTRARLCACKKHKALLLQSLPSRADAC